MIEGSENMGDEIGAFTTQHPIKPRPIVILGAGGIVRDAHLPAYRKTEFQVIGIADVSLEKAAKLQAEYQIDCSFGKKLELSPSRPDMLFFDLAVPASSLLECLKHV